MVIEDMVLVDMREEGGHLSNNPGTGHHVGTNTLQP